MLLGRRQRNPVSMRWIDIGRLPSLKWAYLAVIVGRLCPKREPATSKDSPARGCGGQCCGGDRDVMRREYPPNSTK